MYRYLTMSNCIHFPMCNVYMIEFHFSKMQMKSIRFIMLIETQLISLICVYVGMRYINRRTCKLSFLYPAVSGQMVMEGNRAFCWETNVVAK